MFRKLSYKYKNNSVQSFHITARNYFCLLNERERERMRLSNNKEYNFDNNERNKENIRGKILTKDYFLLKASFL